MALAQGSRENPVQQDPWEMIQEVHWNTGGIGIFEFTADPNFSSVRVKGAEPLLFADELGFAEVEGWVPFPDPPKALPAAGQTLTHDDYKDAYAIMTAPTVAQTAVLAKTELFPIVVDFASVYIFSPEGHAAEIERGNGAAGYPPSLDLSGQVAVFDKTTHTDPDGSHVELVSGYTKKTQWWETADYYGTPVVAGPDGNSTWLHNEFYEPVNPGVPGDQMITYDGSAGYNTELVWYHTGHRAAQFHHPEKRAWIFLFATDRASLGRASNFDFFSAAWKLTVYPSGGKLTVNSDATVSVADDNNTPIAAIRTLTGSIPKNRTLQFSATGAALVTA